MPLPLIIPLAALITGFIALRDRPPDTASDSGLSAEISPAMRSQWTAQIAQQADEADIPLEFALAWMAKESAGNPCAFGSAHAFGPDGNPREMGLGQLYNPDDFNALGIDPSDYRAYCQTGTQVQTRQLTPDEEYAQVKGLIGIISKCRNAARQYNPGGWSESSPNFWRLVKLNHALPGLLHGMSQVTSQLGRPPTDWLEFRNQVQIAQLDHNTMAYSSEFSKLLDNAESTGGVV